MRGKIWEFSIAVLFRPSPDALVFQRASQKAQRWGADKAHAIGQSWTWQERRILRTYQHESILMFISRINPHGFRLAGALETQGTIELDGAAIGG